MANSSRLARALAGVGLLGIGPFLVAWVAVFLESRSPWHSGFAELLFVVAGVVVGTVGVWLLPIKRLFRGLLTVPYVAVMAVATLVSLFPLVCAYFGDCL